MNPPNTKRLINECISFDSPYEYHQIWKPINPIIHPDIKPIYWVSTGGLVYSSSHDIILDAEFTNVGYVRVHLFSNDNTQKHYSIHRLVMESHAPIDNPDKYVVNHKDGHKCNNAIWNLEWVSHRYNTFHSIRNSLQTWKEGDQCSWSSITEATADKIGSMIASQGYTFNYIADVCGCSKAVVHNIAFGISWKFVYVKYKLWRYKRTSKFKFTYDQYVLINKYIEDHLSDYLFDEYRYFCMDLCFDLFNLILDRDTYVDLMDRVYEYLDRKNMI